MGKKVLLFVVFLLFASFVFSQNTKSLEDGLVAYYPFNGNANDESGNGNNGTVYGATLTADRFGNPNSAYSFNGTSNYIVADADSLPTAERTISFWFYTPDVSNHPVPFAYGGGICGTTWFQCINQGMSENAYSRESHCECNLLECPYNQPPENAWYHWVITTSAEGSKMYINGNLFCSDYSFVNNTNVTGKDMAIGVCVSTFGEAPYTDENVGYFNGYLDDFRIYNRALSSSEILELYNENGYNNNIKIELKVLLEGAFNGTDMNTGLNPGWLPLTQPYNDPQKWDYQGTESVTGIPNADIVDWVLVELRETTGDASTAIADSMIARKAAFLLKDGSIVGLDGASPLYFYNEITDNLYVVVYHRNHLPVMSSSPLTENNGTYSWDFTTPAGQAYGTGAQKNLGAVYGMIGGDSDANGVINIDDKDMDWSNDAGKSGYYPGDLNLDTEVNNPDKNDIWEPNLGEESQLPVPITWACGDQIIDDRDGQSYNTVQIGTQCWMAENLNIGAMINSSSDQTNNGIIEKYCYDNNSSNCYVYGGLYQWDEAMQYVTTEGTQGICPTGWHLPTDAEWCTLENYVDAVGVSCSANGWRGTDAGGNLKETGTNHWASPNSDATNSSGFTGLPGGYRYAGGLFFLLTKFANFWSSREYNTDAWSRDLYYENAQVGRNKYDKTYGFSVRCIKD